LTKLEESKLSCPFGIIQFRYIHSNVELPYFLTFPGYNKKLGGYRIHLKPYGIINGKWTAETLARELGIEITYLEVEPVIHEKEVDKMGDK